MYQVHLQLLADRAASAARSEHDANLALVPTKHPEESSPVQNYRALQATAATLRARRQRLHRRDAALRCAGVVVTFIIMMLGVAALTAAYAPANPPASVSGQGKADKANTTEKNGANSGQIPPANTGRVGVKIPTLV